ncbi:DUF5787 family protein [Haloglomus litoreum]|uniref:DUF5787 family protein n=1 Tax=Haloglomus litoreum TaxID=3034026 RepID=UPI0023E7EB28|nr:DUF5787 family protein [Haloglomus sp. DT116]
MTDGEVGGWPLPDREFPFELRVCRWAETRWPPGGDPPADRAVLVARQLGVRNRRWDTLVLECDRAALEARAVFGERALDSDLLHVVRHAPADWAWYREALPAPGYPWQYVREAVHEAAERDLVERRKRGNRIELRREWRYPEWVERVVAIENKPDLDASAARALGDQLERDVALGLADEVWVATRATGDEDGRGVEPALLERLPVEAGILAVREGDGPAGLEVEPIWQPRSLAVDAPGTRILERPAGGDHDQSAARFEYVDPSWKASKRREIAERAYERGWRGYADHVRTDCRHFRLADAAAPLPACAAKGRCVTARECSGSCPSFEPEPPAWRSHGWPIDGGPGKGATRLLERQRARFRE